MAAARLPAWRCPGSWAPGGGGGQRAVSLRNEEWKRLGPAWQMCERNRDHIDQLNMQIPQQGKTEMNKLTETSNCTLMTRRRAHPNSLVLNKCYFPRVGLQRPQRHAGGPGPGPGVGVGVPPGALVLWNPGGGGPSLCGGQPPGLPPSTPWTRAGIQTPSNNSPSLSYCYPPSQVISISFPFSASPKKA